MKRILLCVLLFVSILTGNIAKAEPIDITNRVAWVPGYTVGLTNTYAARTNLIDVTTYGADKTGVTNCLSAVQNAIAAAGSNDVVYFPAGHYLISSGGGITLNKSYVTLRGAGADQTFIMDTSYGYAITVGNATLTGTSIDAFHVYGGATKGSTNLMLSSATTTNFGYTVGVGDIYELAAVNDTNRVPLISVFQQGYILCQDLVVTSVSNGTNITFWPPLGWDYTNAPLLSMIDTHTINGYQPIVGDGIENMTITFTNYGTGNMGTSTRVVSFVTCINSWMTGCKVEWPMNYDVEFTHCLNCYASSNEIRGPNINGSNHGGLLLSYDSGLLVENNLFPYGCFPAIEFNQGFVGNAVFANFFTNNFLGIDAHNVHPMMNLFEANVENDGFIFDGYFGSASHNSVYRNALQSHYVPLFIKRYNTSMQVVGNVLGKPGNSYAAFSSETNNDSSNLIMQFGYPNIGNNTYDDVTPPVPWNYPGSLFNGATNGFFVFTNDQVSTNVLWGNFTNFPTYVNGLYGMAFQDPVNTNVYYPLNGPQITWTGAGTSSNINLNQTITVSNGWRVFLTGQSGYQHLQTSNKLTHNITGNYDYFDNSVIWSNGVMSLPASYLYTNGAPSWWGSDRWPAIDPLGSPLVTNIPAMDRYYGTSPAPPPPSGRTFYISPNGTGNGTSISTPASISLLYPNNGTLQSGDKVICLNGTYTGGNTLIGYPGITLQAQNKWKAIFNGSSIITSPQHIVHDVTIDGLQVTGTSLSGIIIYGSNCVVRNCWIHDCDTSPSNTGQVGTGIAIETTDDGVFDGNCTFEYNISENNGSTGPGGAYQHGIYLKGPNNIVRYNVLRGNYGSGCAGRLTSGTQQIYGNLIYGNKYFGVVLNGNGSAGSEVDYVYNNTILQMNSGFPNQAALAKFVDSTAYFSNNIILSDVQIMNSGVAPIVADYNVQGGGGSSPLTQVHGLTTNFTGVGFVNSSHGLYWLTSGSAARGIAKSTVYGPNDFFGNTQSSVSDIGAFQYNSNYASDTRTLDPSPNIAFGGPDYWAALSAPSTPPSISVQPQNVVTNAGSNVVFSVTASGSTPLSYQWRFNNANLSGATGSSFTTNNVTSGSAGSYTVVVTNIAGSITSSVATLTVHTGPSILSQPQNTTATIGANAFLSVVAVGDPVLAYQWMFNGVPISGATSSTFTTNSVVSGSAGNYTVSVTNTYGSITSSIATLTVNTPTVSPTVVRQPQNLSLTAGNSALFSVIATGDNPLTYQWKYNTQAIPNATNATYFINSATTNNNGTYSVVITNTAGAAVSSNATLVVAQPVYSPIVGNFPTGYIWLSKIMMPIAVPSIVTQPQDVTILRGDTATFTASATGFPNPGYQWYSNGIPIAGAHSTTLSFVDTNLAVGDYIFVVATNALGGAISRNATLIVNERLVPMITASPNSALVSYGSPFTVSSAATGQQPLHYQWYANGSAISGATSSTYTIPSVTRANAGAYYAVVTNSLGSATTATGYVSEAESPVFTTPLTNISAIQGSNVTLQVAAAAYICSTPNVVTNGPISYVWSKAGSGTLASTGTSLSLANISSTDAGTYSIQAFNTLGVSCVPSYSTVTVQTALPYIITQPSPSNQSLPVGQSTRYSVSAGGFPTLTYQWYSNNVAITGATGTSVTVNSYADSVADYYVIVSNQYGSVKSQSVHLSYGTAPSLVSTTPTLTMGYYGTNNPSSMNLSVNVTGTAPLHYQWNLNNDNNPVNYATSSSFNLPVTSAANVVTTNYASCKISNAFGSITVPFKVASVVPNILTSPVIFKPNPNYVIADQTAFFSDQYTRVTGPGVLNISTWTFAISGPFGVVSWQILSDPNDSTYNGIPAFHMIPNAASRGPYHFQVDTYLVLSPSVNLHLATAYSHTNILTVK